MSTIFIPPTEAPELPELPDGAYDIVPHEAGGTFLGWTFATKSRFARRVQHHYVRPNGAMESLRCTSLTDAVNFLRGPAGLDALVSE